MKGGLRLFVPMQYHLGKITATDNSLICSFMFTETKPPVRAVLSLLYAARWSDSINPFNSSFSYTTVLAGAKCIMKPDQC